MNIPSIIDDVARGNIDRRIIRGFLQAKRDAQIAEELGIEVTWIRRRRQTLYNKIGYRVLLMKRMGEEENGR